LLTDFLLPYAYGNPLFKGLLRVDPEDFFVEEQLSFEPEGEGEHIFLWIEKKNLNTEQVAKILAQFSGVAARQVSYSGMKDKRAVTRQWFSVHLPGKSMPDWQSLEQPGLQIKTAIRHRKKLKRGAHVSNRFIIRLKNCEGDVVALQLRLDQIAKAGVPNYFGEQRFGREGRNLLQAKQWFKGELRLKRHQRGIILSSVRSFLFNQILARRVSDQSWDSIIEDEVLILNGSNSVFTYIDCSEIEREGLNQRLHEGDIHPTGMLYGRQKPQVKTLAAEHAVLSQFPEFTAGLESHDLDAQRRSLRLIPKNMQLGYSEAGALEFSFELPKGTYATTVLRELVQYETFFSG
jgi:tRNA pseudouridine13 synthase